MRTTCDDKRSHEKIRDNDIKLCILQLLVMFDVLVVDIVWGFLVMEGF